MRAQALYGGRVRTRQGRSSTDASRRQSGSADCSQDADDVLRALLELTLLRSARGGEIIDRAAVKDDVPVEDKERCAVDRLVVERIGSDNYARLISHPTDGGGREHHNSWLPQALLEI